MYKCKKCGSTKVQHALWVSLNSEEVGAVFGTWNSDDNSFCPDCEEWGCIESVEEPCEACDGLGLLFNPSHSDEDFDGGEPHFTARPNYKPPTVERCDACKMYASDDEALNVLRAVFVKHRKNDSL